MATESKQNTHTQTSTQATAQYYTSVLTSTFYSQATENEGVAYKGAYTASQTSHKASI